MAVFTKSIFRTTDLKERLTSTYFAAQDASGQMDFPFFGEMLQNHRKCPYWTLLRQICPCSQDFTGHIKRKKKKQMCPATTATETVPLKDVFVFVRRVFLKIIPLSALGNIKNRNAFLNHIMELLSIPVHGKLSAIFMVVNIQTKFIEWLKPYSQKEQGSRLINFVKFIVLSFIGPLVKSFFYITCSGSTNELMFYRKKVWHRLLHTTYRKFIRHCKLNLVTQEWVELQRKEGKCLGIFSPHFLPKQDSLRPVVRCLKTNGRATVNEHLKCLHLVLSYEREMQPQNFGASILGMDEFHHKWKKYHINMKDKRPRRYYFVKTDLLNCYDNIDPVLLFNIMKELLKSSYIVYKYKRLAHIKGKKQTVFFESLKRPSVICSRVDVDMNCVDSYEIKSRVLLEKLHALLFCNVVKLGSNVFIQTNGIPQGAKISSLLCAAYFGYMDKTACAKFLGRHEFLIRMTDDILFVTPHKETAKAFLQLMLDGVPAMKCISNFSKCLINFNYCHSVLGKVSSVCEDQLLSYCGICINPKSLEISVDFSNFKGKDRVPVSWELTHNTGGILQKKILNSVNPQCFSALFDADINSEQHIVYNILCKFAVCSVKFHYLVMRLPVKQRALNNPSFFTQVIQSLPNYFYVIVTRSLKKVSKLFKKDLLFPVSKATLRSLCNNTFLYKLQRHHAMYAPVIDNLLKIEKKKRLDSALCKQLSVVFDSIHLKY
ncbi:hypothetical protein EGW08_022557 [Elysia chlorotica]|uniref:Telomerase reverse transcriptase n=1 Tax=Elysia chlorotica TaxID=188477 RepID=A0A433SKM7_ELYCH|nr:hypothetical protein EGW08_022557 [Elysia chlorotica]